MVPPVAVLLVSHDGRRWLPAVIDGIRSQQVPVDHVVCVDTGSKDDSADLLRTAFGEVLTVSGATSFPAAVGLGLDRLRELGSATGAPLPEWVWILHDDANPAPDALAALLAAAEADPAADVLGPKLREWPSLKRLLELGVTISGTGRRETGLERGEYDQGQHDEVREVLAVNTAGMLVRRSVLEELGGFDTQLPIFGNDIDFGWRAAAAGHRTLVVPDAVVFHAEAAHRGVRRTPLTGRHTHYQERRAALYTLLANARRRSLPWLVVRLALGTVLRMLGFFLVRAVGEALDDLAALLSLYAHPGEVRGARRRRHQGEPVAQERARSLLAPWWVPYRHGLDFLGDIVTAATNQAQDVAERRRAAAAEHAPASTVARPRGEDDELVEDTGAVARFLTNPVALGLALFVVLALVAGRDALGGLAGGALSPPPDAVSDWWRLHLETWHPLGTGTAVPAPPYLAPLALLASLLGGSPSAAVSALFLLAAPLGLWGAWRFLRVAGRLVTPAGAPRWVLLWGAATWALVPVASGAWGEGRLGVVAVAALLPWLAHAALGFADPAPERRWRAAWRAGLLLALASAFTPVLWLVAALLGVVVVAAAAGVVRGAVRDRSVWGPPSTALALAPVLLSPWWVPAIQRGASDGLLLDMGRVPMPSVDGLDLLAGRLGDTGAPWWLGVLLAALAVLALLPRTTRVPALVCWVVALVTAVLAALLGSVSLSLATAVTEPGLGALVVVLQGAFLVAATLGAVGLGPHLTGWRRLVAAVLGVVAAAVPLGGLVWWLAGADAVVTHGVETDIPVYMVQTSEEGPGHGILVLRGSVEDGLSYVVRRGDGVTTGEDEILDLTSPDDGFTGEVRALVSRPTPQVIQGLGEAGIEYVVLPSPADGDVAAVLDAAGGLVQASAADRTTRAWQVDRPLDDSSLDGSTSWLRVVLLVVQGVGAVVVLVLCLPTTSRRRSA